LGVYFQDHAGTCRQPCSGPAKQQNLATSICKNETLATATKIIRIPDANILVDFFKDLDNVNGKIVMLVRDPRAMLESRKNIAMGDGLWRRDQKAMLDQLG
jgi:hypothetical protein